MMCVGQNLTSDISVSVVIPAFNAADTIAKTLKSLLAQTYPHWQAIVVDDGSVDQTASVLKEFAGRDPRILYFKQPNAGVSAARNTGIQNAQFDWLLFLDADDWVAPNFLQKMMGELQIHPTYDVICCHWKKVTAQGSLLNDEIPYKPNDSIFEQLACSCIFAIHACVVRKSCVEAIGYFDPTLTTCEDWDLWQRLARSGAEFGMLPEVLAYYQMRANSASTSAKQLYVDGLRVIEQGHKPDPRVKNSSTHFATGRSLEQLAITQFYYQIWIAGLLMVGGGNAQAIVQDIPSQPMAELDTHMLAHSLFAAFFKSGGHATDDTNQRWNAVAQASTTFLSLLEAHLQMPSLAQRSRIHLERLVLQQTQPTFPISLGITYGVRIEVSEPISDIYPPEGTERLYATLSLEGDSLGVVELPSCDGWVSGSVLADAIAADYAWEILARFFSHTIYPTWPNEGGYSFKLFHQDHGWLTFLRELWDRPHWSMEQFYDRSTIDKSTATLNVGADPVQVELSHGVPDLVTHGEQVTVIIAVGGVCVGSLVLPASDGNVTAQALRVAILEATGIELCRVCVREGLIGRSLSAPFSLRERLQDNPKFLLANWSVNSPTPTEPAPLILGHRPEPIGTAASRRANLPIATKDVLLDLAKSTNEWVLEPQILSAQSQSSTLASSAQHASQRIIYAPSSVRGEAVRSLKPLTPPPSLAQISPCDRAFFEQLFASDPDPWKYTSSYEQVKYEQTLSLLPQTRIEKALELACAEGHFTIQLAPLVEHLVAADISQIALNRTADRCAALGLNAINYQLIDIARDPIPGTYDLIVCSEVLYYMGSRHDLAAIALKFTDALDDNGYLLMTHANVVVDAPNEAGFDWDVPFGAKFISETFSATSGLQLRKEILTPLNRIQLFQKQTSGTEQAEPISIRYDQQPTALPPDVETMVLWQGGERRHWGMDQAPTTDRLPILMYHQVQVAAIGSAQLRRWRTTPEAFDEQMRYLRDSGYYTVTLEDWRIAQQTKSPLPGRAVLITFDDGYQDFYTEAFPILQQYGFSATVFIVADRIGQTNGWDAVYGEPQPLMDWSQIRELQAAGIEFGSHSATHRPLTGLSNAEIVTEAARSRTILTRELGESPRSIAYPYGDTDPVVQHLMGACGYTFGLTCQSGLSHYNHSLLALPRVEVMGSDSLEQFVQKLK